MKSFHDPVLGPAHVLKCELASEVLRSSGMLRVQVTGWSMLPAVWPGDMLVIESANSRDISEGDIVLFGRDGRLFVHRVVAKAGTIDHTQFVTQGDGMKHPDPPVTSSQLLGKVSLIMRDGKCLAPKSSLSFSERTVAALVRRSDSAARVLIGVHGMRQNSREQVSPCPS